MEVVRLSTPRGRLFACSGKPVDAISIFPHSGGGWLDVVVEKARIPNHQCFYVAAPIPAWAHEGLSRPPQEALRVYCVLVQTC